MTPTKPSAGLPLRVDAANVQVWHGEQLLKLTPKSFAVLHYLSQHAGQLVTKAALMGSVWADTIVTDGALAACIRELRKALHDDIRFPQYIETVHRHGYRLIISATTAVPLVSASEFQLAEATVAGSPDQRGTRQAERATALVGRDAELAFLHTLFAKALTGARQFVFVTGEPGIGKTTLIDAFLAETRDWGQGRETDNQQATMTAPDPLPAVSWVGHGQCIEHYGAGEAYLPVLEALGRLCRGPDGERLIGLLHQHAPMWLLQMPAFLNSTDYDALQRITQGATRERMLRELAEALEVMTAERPLILVLEDLHWSDSSTLDLLSILARRPEPARLLVMSTYRPIDVIVRGHPLKTVKEELHLHDHCQELALELLSEPAIAEYLMGRFGVLSSPRGAASPEQGQQSQESECPASWQGLAHLIYHSTEGNPLFMVAMLDDLVARGLIVQTATEWEWQAEATAIAERIPDSIRQLVTLQRGRLLPEEQQTLAAASIAGLEFSAASVAAALMTETGEVERQCQQLADRQSFLRRVGIEEWPDGTLAARYRFSHAVYQRLWHEGTSPTQLQHYHRHIGERKERAYGERAREIAVELALHFEQGRDYPKAVQALQHAAQNAFSRHALHEVIAHASTGLALLHRLPDTSGCAQQELILQMLLGAALLTTQGFAAPEVGRVYARALALSRQLGGSPHLFPILFGLTLFYATQGQIETAREIEMQLHHLAQRHPDPLHCAEVHFVSGLLLFTRGECASAQVSFERSLALYEPQQTAAHLSLYGQHPGVAAGVLSAFNRWQCGCPDQALTQAQTVLLSARESAHPYSLALALFWVAQLYQVLGKARLVQTHTEELVLFAQAQGIANGRPYGLVLHGWALAEQRRLEEGLARIHTGLAEVQTLGIQTGKGHCFAWLAEAYSKTGQFAEGLQALAEAQNAVGKTGERWYAAELCRLKGELTLQQARQQTKSKKYKSSTPSSQEAEACFLNAIDIAREQHAKSWELRATLSLARLWQQQGKSHAAHSMLSDIYTWFTEGFDTKDLQEAKALLEELRDERPKRNRRQDTTAC